MDGHLISNIRYVEQLYLCNYEIVSDIIEPVPLRNG